MPQVSTVRINGPALRDLRIRRGLSLRQLAARTGGRHPQSIRRLETDPDGKLASRVFAYQIANALGLEEIGDFTLSDDEADAQPKGAAA